MGIDAGAFAEAARDSETIARVRRRCGPARVLVGIDRLDYTKGIPFAPTPELGTPDHDLLDRPGVSASTRASTFIS
jgi:hypothetical protein